MKWRVFSPSGVFSRHLVCFLAFLFYPPPSGLNLHKHVYYSKNKKSDCSITTFIPMQSCSEFSERCSGCKSGCEETSRDEEICQINTAYKKTDAKSKGEDRRRQEKLEFSEPLVFKI